MGGNQPEVLGALAAGPLRNVRTPAVLASLHCHACAGYPCCSPKRRYKARLRDMRSLRDLLIYHLDDLDDVLDQVGVLPGDD